MNIINNKTNLPLTFIHKFFIFFSCFMVNTLDGYLLIFIAFNSHIYETEWKWSSYQIISITFIYHMVTAFGQLFAILTSTKSNRIGLYYASLLFFLVFFFSLPILFSINCLVYQIILSSICFSNGHYTNIINNLLIQKAHKEYRAFVFFIAGCGFLFGQLFFTVIMFTFPQFLSWGHTIITIVPLFVILFLQLVSCNLIIMFVYYHRRAKDRLIQDRNKNKMKAMSNKDKDKTINNNKDKDRDRDLNKNNNSDYDEVEHEALLKEMGIRTPKMKAIQERIQNKFSNDIEYLIIKPFNTILTNQLKQHTINTWLLNFSIGIQFLSMINVFPMQRETDYFAIITQNNRNILLIKISHCIIAFFCSLLYLVNWIKLRKLLLTFFFINLILNCLIVFDITDIIKSPYTNDDSTILFHVFRNLWMINYITLCVYCTEATSKRLRNMTTAIGYFIFKTSCLLELISFDELLYLHPVTPVAFNVFVLLAQIYAASNMKIETHYKELSDIEAEIDRLKNEWTTTEKQMIN